MCFDFRNQTTNYGLLAFSLADVISVPATDKHYRLLYDVKGRYVPLEITKDEAKVCLLPVVDRCAVCRPFLKLVPAALHAFFGRRLTTGYVMWTAGLAYGLCSLPRCCAHIVDC